MPSAPQLERLPNRRSDSVLWQRTAELYRAVRKSYKDHAKDHAAAIAFYGLFSVFPLLLGLISAAGFLLESEVAQERVFEAVDRAIPASAELVRDNLQTVVRLRGRMGLAGVIGLFWAASAGFGAITRAINTAIGAKRRHPFFLSKVRYFLMTLAASALLLLSLATSTLVEVVADLEWAAMASVDLEALGLSRLSGWAASATSAFVMFALIYKVTPYVETRWRQVLPGALLATLVFELGKGAFLFYLDRVQNYRALYGSLSSIMILLVWLYVSALVLLFGAEYNVVRATSRESSERET